MAVALVLGTCAVLLILSGVVVAIPRWCVRSLHRHRMWRLRDKVADDIIAGRLPLEHPAVVELLDDFEGSIHVCSSVTILDGLILHRLTRHLSPGAARALDRHYATEPLDGLDPQQQDLTRYYRNELEKLSGGSMLLGSWFGLAFVLWMFPRTWHREHAPAVAFSSATDEALQETKMGQRVMQWAEEQLCDYRELILH